MNDFSKMLLLVLLVAYVVSPIDLCPGPIDDALMIALYLFNQKSVSSEY